MLKKTNVSRIALSLIVCAAAARIVLGASPVSFRVVYSVNGYQQPGGILEGSPGVFYTSVGNPDSVLSVTSGCSPMILGTFPTGLFQSCLVSGPNNRFYSSIYSGSTYNVFSETASPGGQVTYSNQTLDAGFTQNLPDGTLLAAAANMSTAIWGPAKSDLNGNLTPLSQLPSGYRLENVIYASDGNYYGVAQGTFTSAGYVFRLTPSGTMTTLYNFPNNTFTAWLAAPLLRGSDGNLYGATATGGANGTGTIYKLTPSGQYTPLHSFGKGTFGRGPFTLIEASDGNLYGGSQNDTGSEEIFRITKSGNYAVLYTMSVTDGLPPCFLIQGSDGIFYGTALAGGAHGAGDIFALNAGLPKPKPQAPSPRLQPEVGAGGNASPHLGLQSALRFRAVQRSRGHCGL